MKEIKCPNCEKEHKSKERYCSFCGQDLESVILKYKEKNLPISYSGKVRKGPPKTCGRILSILTILFALTIIIASILYGVYPDLFSYYENTPQLNFMLFIICFVLSFFTILVPTILVNLRIVSEGRAKCGTKAPFFTEEERDQKPMKVKKIPSQGVFNLLVILTTLLLLSGGITLVISIYSDISRYVGIILLVLGFMLFIPVLIIRSLILSKGRTFCFSNVYPKPSDYETTGVESCFAALEGCSSNGSSCGFVFLIFLIDLVSLIFNKK